MPLSQPPSSGSGASGGTPAVVLGSSVAAGSATTFLRDDDMIAAFDATDPTTSLLGDTAGAGSVAKAARRDHRHGRELFGSAGSSAVGDSAFAGVASTPGRSDHVHGREAFATPAVVLGSSAAAGSATTLVRSDSTIAAFDATAPITQAFSDAAAVGSAAFAARRDHKHGMPADPTASLGVAQGARVYNSGAFSVGASTETAITFDTERSDSNAFHSTGSNTERFTIPTGGAGRYTITGSVEWAASALGTLRRLSIRLNGSTYIAKDEITSIINAALPQNISTVYDLADADYVELVAFQDTVGSVNLNTAGNYSPEFGLSLGGVAPASGAVFKRTILNGNGNIAFTSTTKVAIDATNLAYLTLTLAVNDVVECGLFGSAKHSASANSGFDFEVDQPTSANTYIGAGADYGISKRAPSIEREAVAVVGMFTATEAGSHGFRPAALTDSGTLTILNAASSDDDVTILFYVKKLGPVS